MRAFTQLFDDDQGEILHPLYTDTYLSLPLRTHAGEATRTHTHTIIPHSLTHTFTHTHSYSRTHTHSHTHPDDFHRFSNES